MGAQPDQIERRIEQQRREATPKIEDFKRQLSDDISTVKSEAGERVKQIGHDSGTAARNARNAMSGVLHLRSDNALMARLIVGFAVGLASRMVLPDVVGRDGRNAALDRPADIEISP